jgi:hypothetical protein
MSEAKQRSEDVLHDRRAEVTPSPGKSDSLVDRGEDSSPPSTIARSAPAPIESVDEASEESVPASDAPSWTPVTRP